VLTGTLDASRRQMTVGAPVAPLLATSTLGWSVALRVVVCPTDNDIFDCFDVTQFGRGHCAFLEVQDEIAVLKKFCVANFHRLDVIRVDVVLSQSLFKILNRHVVETEQNDSGLLLRVDLVRKMRNLAVDAALQERLIFANGGDFDHGTTLNLLQKVVGTFNTSYCHLRSD